MIISWVEAPHAALSTTTRYLTDKNTVMAPIDNADRFALKCASKTLNFIIVFLSGRQVGWNLQFASREVQGSPTIVNKVREIYPAVLSYASDDEDQNRLVPDN